MRLLGIKEVEVGKDKYPIKLSFRAMIEYESITGQSIQAATGTEQIVILFYCAAKAGAKATGSVFAKDYEAFLDIVDNYPESLISFMEALSEGSETPEDSKKLIPKVTLIWKRFTDILPF